MGDGKSIHAQPTALAMRLLVAVAAAAVVLGVLAPAMSAAAPAAPVVSCRIGDPSCDVDGDRIPDDVEVAVCGSVTCATGVEDSDGDGLPDWVEFQATGSVVGADPALDSDGDGIPDFAELIVCGTPTCATGDEDVDGDGAPDWIEVVVCGDTTCATGKEDFDGDGIADAVRLAARPPTPLIPEGRPAGSGPLAFTGARVALLALFGAALVIAGVGLTRMRRGRLQVELPAGDAGKRAGR